MIIEASTRIDHPSSVMRNRKCDDGAGKRQLSGHTASTGSIAVRVQYMSGSFLVAHAASKPLKRQLTTHCLIADTCPAHANWVTSSAPSIGCGPTSCRLFLPSRIRSATWQCCAATGDCRGARNQARAATRHADPGRRYLRVCTLNHWLVPTVINCL